MRHRGWKLFVAAFLLSTVCSITALAATAIQTVDFSYTVRGDSAITEGYNDPMIEIRDNSMYEISDFSCVSDTSTATGKTALTYTLTLSARRNYYFPTASSVTVNGSGITEVTRKTTDSSDNTLFTVRFKAYPYYQLTEPSFITEFDSIKGNKSNSVIEGRETTLNFNKNGAPKIEYYIGYFDQDGEYKTKSGTTTGSSITVSTFNKRYTGTSSSKRSCYIRGIAIRAAGNLGSNINVAPSNWVYISGGLTNLDTEEYFNNYSVWDDLLTGTDGSTVSSAGSGSSSNTVLPMSGSNVNVFGWDGSGDEWYYYSNGSRVTGWLYDGSNWYYCDASTGRMRVGWIQDSDGRWYYLNTNHDGTYGCMLTGWIYWNGSYYYLNPNAGGPMGSMVTGTVNIDGKIRNFASSGALIG